MVLLKNSMCSIHRENAPDMIPGWQQLSGDFVVRERLLCIKVFLKICDMRYNKK